MIKALLQKMFGSYLEKKAELYDGTPTEGKAWYKSKTVLAGIYLALRGLYEAASVISVSAGKPKLPEIPAGLDAIITAVLGAAVVQGRVNSNKPIVITEDQPPKDQR